MPTNSRERRRTVVVGKTIFWKAATATYATVAILGALAGIATRILA